MGEEFEQTGCSLLLVLNAVLQLCHFGQKFTVNALMHGDVARVQTLCHHHAFLVFKVVMRVIAQRLKHSVNVAGGGLPHLGQRLAKAVDQVHQNAVFPINGIQTGFKMLVPMKGFQCCPL